MDHERLGDMEPPFGPARPEDFIAQSEMAFLRWWEELEPPGTKEGIELDHISARMIWQTAYEHQSVAIELVLDCAKVHCGGAATIAELYLGYVVDRFHGGSVAFPTKAFINWLAHHEDDYFTYVDESEHVHIRIKSRGDDPLPMEPGQRVSRVRPSSPETVRASALRSFLQWWERLDPPSSHEGRSLDADETRVVWLAACGQMWEELESIHESAHAHSDVTSETANHELAYLVDNQHHGKLTFGLNDLMDWSQQHEQNIRRSRNWDTVAIWIEHIA
ncbi:MAG: hypothetical protein ABL921_24850 [Pirellula sp.]